MRKYYTPELSTKCISNDRTVGHIYSISCPDTFTIRYIGQTAQDYRLRFKQHEWSGYKLKSHLGFWLKKIKNNGKIPIFSIIECCDVDSLDQRELFWIEYYNGNNLVNSMHDVYKSGRHCHTDDTKRKIAEAVKRIHTGMKRSAETRRKISVAAKNRKFPSPMLGRKFSSESIEKRLLKIRKPILQFDLNGVFVKRWRSSMDIYNETGFFYTNISACARGKQKTGYGYIWKFEYA